MSCELCRVGDLSNIDKIIFIKEVKIGCSLYLLESDKINKVLNKKEYLPHIVYYDR